jgi:hypothetical protein
LGAIVVVFSIVLVVAGDVSRRVLERRLAT